MCDIIEGMNHLNMKQYLRPNHELIKIILDFQVETLEPKKTPDLPPPLQKDMNKHQQKLHQQYLEKEGGTPSGHKMGEWRPKTKTDDSGKAIYSMARNSL